MLNKKRYLKNSAFSLMEILATVAVITVLLGLSIVGIKRVKRNAYDQQAVDTLKLIHTAMQGYASINNGEFTYDSNPLVAEARLRQGSKPLLNRRYCSSATDRTYLSHWYYNCKFTCQHSYAIGAYPESADYGNRCYAIKKDGTIIEGNSINDSACNVALPSKCPDYEFDDGGGGGGGSCPLVFTFDGEKYNLEADILLTSALAHLKMPNMPEPEIDSDEYIKLLFLKELQDGTLKLSLMESNEEISYIDNVSLLAIDHPDDIEILLNERPAIHKPFPEFKLYQAKDMISPVKAYDKEGNDVSGYLTEKDGQYVPLVKTELDGFVKPYALVLELGDLSNAGNIQLIVNAYFKPAKMDQISSAVKQGSLCPDYPFIEVPDGSGGWKEVGFEASVPLAIMGSNFKTKDHVYDLTGVFVNNDYRVRICSNMEIYFDYIAVNTFSDYRSVKVHTLKPNNASLNEFGILKSLPSDLIPFDYYQIDTDSKIKPAKGSYTRFGDVLELVLFGDDKYVIMAPGDDLSLTFNAKDLPIIQNGFKRSYVLYAKGYHKWIYHDIDIYSQVAPLPFSEMTSYPYPETESYPLDTEYKEYLEKYNTRIVQ